MREGVQVPVTKGCSDNQDENDDWDMDEEDPMQMILRHGLRSGSNHGAVPGM
jgi:hypothetical protein